MEAPQVVSQPAGSQAEKPTASRARAGEGTPIGLLGQIGFGLYLILMALGICAFMIWVWDVRTGEWQGPIDTDAEFIALVLAAGALGSFIHVATSFATFVGNRSLEGSWLWWYILRPFIGAALALIAYFVIRGGLMLPGSDAPGALSPFGVAAMAGLVGMFSKQAADKLCEVFDNLFRTEIGKGDDTRAGKLPAAAAPAGKGGEGSSEPAEPARDDAARAA